MANKPFGVEELNIVGSAGTSIIEAVADLHIQVGGGRTVGIGTSIFDIQDGTADANNDSVLNVGIVTANEYYGTFKGIIDPGTSTISIASSLTDVIGVNANQIYPKIASEDSILFWDFSATKTTYLKIGDGVTIADDTLKGDYTLPVTGTTGGDGVGEASWTLTPSSGTGDPVKVKAGTNLSINADNVGSGEFTLSVNQAAGLELDTSVTDIFDLTSGVLSADDPEGDRIVFWDESESKLTHLEVDGTSISITGTTLSANAQTGTTYNLPIFGTTNGGSGIKLTPTGGTASGAQTVNITGSSGITVIGSGTDTLTIDGTSVTGTTYALKCTKDSDGGSTGTDADPYLFLDASSGTDDAVQIVGTGGISVTRNNDGKLTIDATSDSNTTYTLPTFGTVNGASGLSLTDNDGGTDDVTITGTGGITVVGNALANTLTIDGSGASGDTYTFTAVADVTNVNLRLNDGTSNQDVLITAGNGITIDNISSTGFELIANANAGKTYTLPTFGTTNDNSGLLLTDDQGGTDGVVIRGTGGITVVGNSATGGNMLTIDGSGATGSVSVDSTTDDVFSITGTNSNVFSADDPGEDRIVFWDDSATRLKYLKLGTGLEIDDFTINATGDANFSVPGSDKQVLFNDGTYLAAASTLEYDKGGSGTLIKIDGYIGCKKSGNDNYVHLSADGGVEIKRNDPIVNTTQGPYVDFITTGSDYDARIQMERVVTNPGTDSFSSIIFITGGDGSTSEKLRIGKAGEIGIAGANYGTLGQVLTSGGPGGSVTWESGTSATTVTVDDEGSTSWRDIVYSAGAGAGKSLRVNDAAGAVNGLQVRGSDGSMRVKGDITAFRGSDRRLKDNISPIKNALAKVSSISGNIFTWNEKSTDDKRGNDDTGVIAQEITALELPGVTTTRDDGTQAVMYEKLVPLLIEAIKELKEEVDELKSRS